MTTSENIDQISGLMNYISTNGDKKQCERMQKIVNTFIGRLENIDSEIQK